MPLEIYHLTSYDLTPYLTAGIIIISVIVPVTMLTVAYLRHKKK